MRLEGLTIADDALAALDDETVAALIAFRYGRLLDAGVCLEGALILAARTDRSLESILSQRRQAVAAAYRLPGRSLSERVGIAVLGSATASPQAFRGHQPLGRQPRESAYCGMSKHQGTSAIRGHRPDAAVVREAVSFPAQEAHGLAAGLARRLNEQIVRVAEMLPAGTEHEYGFACECGCDETVLLSLSTFVEGGAWVAGHKPK